MLGAWYACIGSIREFQTLGDEKTLQGVNTFFIFFFKLFFYRVLVRLKGVNIQTVIYTKEKIDINEFIADERLDKTTQKTMWFLDDDTLEML